ncbi:hypothetical protein [Lentzea cavernae]|uniref:Uncharacterized protein n=1 Tax=Lentzea cavernae TaxID=2020703 RepID=A0ABQ3MQJ3_9PSEU|nr:hypothetical protein [Lentzea cavernae]GHH57879.1 hypothetical protein GCM10017774_78320 [Lentzea cavernae]
MTTPDRYADLTHRVHQRYAAGGTVDRNAFNNDPTFRASVEMIRKMLTATDAALAAEGVDEVTRDRVAYRVLYGEAPHSYPVPDSHEALARLRARDEQLQRLAKLDLPKIQVDWLP